MTVRNLRAALTAILLGTATAGVTTLALASPAQAVTVSAKVGPLLQGSPGHDHRPRTTTAPRPS